MKMVPVSKSVHGNQVWRRLNTYSFAGGNTYVPIAAAELGRAATALPIAFAQLNGQMSLIAVLSILSGRNMFVAPNGQWLATYVPILFRCYPFGLLQAGSDDQFALFVDEDADKLPDTAAATELFYDSDGNLAPAVKAMMELLTEFERSRKALAPAISALAAEKLIIPWPLKIQGTEGAAQTIAGLSRVDEQALNTLPDEAFLRLRKLNALPIAYAQLLSMGHAAVFPGLLQAHRAMQGMAAPAARVPGPAGGESGFIMNDLDALRFD